MNLKSYKRHGEGGSTDAAVIEEKHQHIQKLIEKSGYVLRDILNMNETGLFYAYALYSGLYQSILTCRHKSVCHQIEDC